MAGKVFSRTIVALPLLIAASIACVAAREQAAQQKPETRGRITEIHATGSKRYPEAAIVAASGLKVGDSVGREELQAAADHLGEVGTFSSVRYHFTSRGDDISLQFQIEDAPTIPVWFDNFPWFTDSELSEGIKQAVNLFDGTAPQQGTILEAMDAALQTMLSSRGVKASVTHMVVAEPGGDQMILEFQVQGANLLVNAVQFGDPLAAESKQLRDVVSDLVGKPYSRFAIAVFASEQVVPLYLAQGRLRVKIGSPAARFTGDPNKPLPNNVLVLLPIEPGLVYHWSGVEWTNDGAASKPQLDALVTLKPGDRVNGLEIQRLWQRVEDEYAAHGFLDAKINPQPAFDDAAQRVAYRVSITAGPRYHMGEMVITGLSLDAERKLREAWPIPHGQVFDRLVFDEFVASGVKKAFGDSPIHYDKVGRWLRTHPENQTVDVLLDFQ